jgi:hypothetical protein
MNTTVAAIVAGAGFGLWALVMSLSGLRAGGVAFMMLAGTLLVTAPWYLIMRPDPFIEAGRSTFAALVIGLGAACLNGLGMIVLPSLLEAPPAVVGARILIINVTVVSVGAIWTMAFDGSAVNTSKVAGVVMALLAVWLLSRA